MYGQYIGSVVVAIMTMEHSKPACFSELFACRGDTKAPEEGELAGGRFEGCVSASCCSSRRDTAVVLGHTGIAGHWLGSRLVMYRALEGSWVGTKTPPVIGGNAANCVAVGCFLGTRTELLVAV